MCPGELCGCINAYCHLRRSAAAVSAGRSLKQASGVDYPGCVPVGNSVLAHNPDFTSFLIAANSTGLLDILEQLPSPATLFVPTYAALTESALAANLTAEEAFASPLTPGALDYFVVPEPFLVRQIV